MKNTKQKRIYMVKKLGSLPLRRTVLSLTAQTVSSLLAISTHSHAAASTLFSIEYNHRASVCRVLLALAFTVTGGGGMHRSEDDTAGIEERDIHR